MDRSTEPHAPGSPSRLFTGDSVRLFSIEALASTGGTLLSVGLPFFTNDQFHWGPGRNFALAAAQGAVYIPGALLAGRLSHGKPGGGGLGWLYFLLALIATVGGWLAHSEIGFVVTVLVHTVVIALTWPVLEGLVAQGVDSATLGRRLAFYNVVWPAPGAAAIAIEGSVLRAWPGGVFYLPAMAYLLAAVLAWSRRKHAAPGEAPQPPAHLDPEPELLRARTRALWISRLALPATYAVMYGLMPLMPDLAVMKQFDTQIQTAIGSTWLIARWATFAVLAMSTWWHTRPRAMVGAAVVMLVAYLGITLPPSQLWHLANARTLDLSALIAWQVFLGVALGVIYSGSLYFGMVLSEGSTEHGGYHEALIGLGWVLGPLVGAAAQWAYPGDVTAGVVAVGGVIGASVLAVAGAGVFVGRGGSGEGEGA